MSFNSWGQDLDGFKADLAFRMSDSVILLVEVLLFFVLVDVLIDVFIDVFCCVLFISLVALSEQKLWDFCKLKGDEVVLTAATLLEKKGKIVNLIHKLTDIAPFFVSYVHVPI